MTPVVFVHGFMGGSLQWQAQAAALKGRNVIALDLPGYGQNASCEALGSIAEYADWALCELQRHGIERFALVGHSMGGMVVQEMIARAPERVERLVLYGTGATGVLPGRFETISTSKKRACDDGPIATARRIAATWFLDGEKAEGYSACAQIAEACSLEVILAGLSAMQGWDGTAQLADIKAKTLVLWGDHDRTYPWRQTEHLWNTVQGADLAVLPSCAHAAHLEKPGLFNALLEDFLTH